MTPTSDPGFDGRVADWLEHDPDTAPGTVLSTVVAAVGSIEQRQRGRRKPVTRTAASGLVAMVAVLAVVAVALTIRRTVPFSAGGDVPSAPPVGSRAGPLAGVQFGGVARISTRWFGGDGIAFTATVPPAFELQRWRAATYDTYEGDGWIQTQDHMTRVPMGAGQPLLQGIGEAVDPAYTDEATVSVDPVAYNEPLVLAPGATETVNRATNLDLFGAGGWFAGLELRDDPGGPYQVKAAALTFLSNEKDMTEGITQNKLRVAGGAYPPDILADYTNVPANAIGPNARKLLDTMVKLSPSDNPYDLASTFEAYLHSPTNFRYDTNLTDVDCGSAGAVECFATFKRGYCLHYASTMAILLRAAVPGRPIPTRLVQGFLPGTLENGTTTVRIRDAHAWVEVYFPGYGWIPFDPTGNVGQPVQLPHP
jgi:transglutaminase-like putative cysteine protease